MSISVIELRVARTQNVQVTDDELIVALDDGRTIVVSLAWYPRLLHGRKEKQENWRLIGAWEGIHWADLDENISVEHLLAGIPSGENQKSFQNWLITRRKSCTP